MKVQQRLFFCCECSTFFWSENPTFLTDPENGGEMPLCANCKRRIDAENEAAWHDHLTELRGESPPLTDDVPF